MTWNEISVYGFTSDAAPPFVLEGAQKELLEFQPGPPVFAPLSKQWTPRTPNSSATFSYSVLILFMLRKVGNIINIIRPNNLLNPHTVPCAVKEATTLRDEAYVIILQNK